VPRIIEIGFDSSPVAYAEIQRKLQGVKNFRLISVHSDAPGMYRWAVSGVIPDDAIAVPLVEDVVRALGSPGVRFGWGDSAEERC